MPAPTRQEILSHKTFLRRQKIYENKYRKKIYAYLQSVNYAAAKAYESGQFTYDIKEDRLERIYKQLYTEVTLNEGKLQWQEFDDPKQKDLMDVLAGLLSDGESVPIRLWRSLMQDFITTRIAGRITDVTQTTRKRIAVLIERGINEGLGADEVARMIRKDRGFNQNRSLAIARTETITSANQGKYLAAISSPFVKMKKWLPTNDSRTRLSHKDFLDRPFVEMEQLFFVANAQGFLEEARYPCDSTLSASNTVNCRCIIVFKNKLDSNGLPIKKNSLNL